MKKRKKNQSRWIILTGLSGSGKTSALKVLEDQGFSTIDNLPLGLLPSLVNFLKKSREKIPRLVLGMDARGKDFLHSYHKMLTQLKEAGVKPEILFLDCRQRVLIQRFSETRRPHPLKKGKTTLEKAINEEKRYLEPLKKLSTKVFDTSEMNVHQLKSALHKYLSLTEKITPLTISLVSFGYKFGIPMEADMLFDVRFLDNPFFVPRLKNRPGTSPAVKKFVLGQKDAKTFLQQMVRFFLFLFPKFQKEGKSFLTIGFGCTGGRHRSVVIVETLQEKLSQKDWKLVKIHRDMAKE